MRLASAQRSTTVLSGTGQSSTGRGWAYAGFGFTPTLPTGFIPTAVVSGDFNRDGHLDLAISSGGDDSIYIYFGNGDGTFQVPAVLHTQGQSPDWMTTVSLRSNNVLDLIISDGDSQEIEVFLGNGDGTFSPGVQVKTPSIPTFLAQGDINQDGKADIVVGLTVAADSTQAQLEVLLGDGAGGFSNTIVAPPVFNHSPDVPMTTAWLSVGDINGDGFPDVLLSGANNTDSIGSVPYLNQQGTAFADPQVKDGAFNNYRVLLPDLVGALADMNGDGCLDAATLDWNGHASVWLGSCDGNFTPHSAQGADASVGDFDLAIAIADMDGDGHLDVLGSSEFPDLGPGLGNEAGFLLSIMKGDGQGGLSNAKVYREGADTFSFALGDFNEDGKLDVVSISQSEDKAYLLLSDATGNLAGPQGEAIGHLTGTVNAPISISSVLSVDLNGDAKPDLLLAEFGTDSTVPSQLTVMLNDGTGKFLPPLQTPISVGSHDPLPLLATGVFGPGIVSDLIYANRAEWPESVVRFPGKGDGTFAAPVILGTLNPQGSLTLQKIVVADFNGDGKLDFAVCSVGPSFSRQVDVFLGHGDGTFSELPSQILTTSNPAEFFDAFAIDINHDGKMDLLLSDTDNAGLTLKDDLVEILGNGDGSFQTPVTLFSHFGPVAIADVNGDGLPDLIQARDPDHNFTAGDVNIGTSNIPAATTIYLADRGGGFQRAATYTLDARIAWPFTKPVLVGDFNGDGIFDLALKANPLSSNGPQWNYLQVFQGDGTGTFSTVGRQDSLAHTSDPILGADFNGDGATDLLELDGALSSIHTIPAAPESAVRIAVDSAPLVGSSGTATVTLALPAAVDLDVAIGASDTHVQLPSTLHFTAGEQEQSFAFALQSGFDSTHALRLAATLATTTDYDYVTVANPNVPTGVAVTWVPNGGQTVTPGEALKGVLWFTSVGGYSGTYQGFTCDALPPSSSCDFGSGSVQMIAGATARIPLTIITSSSTPLGNYPVPVSASDGFAPTGTTIPVGVGDFSLAVSPAILTAGPTGFVFAKVIATYSNGLGETISFSCSGLPISVRCTGGFVTPMITSAAELSTNQAPAGDYPFQIVGTLNALTHTADAVLRVGDFSGSLDKTTASLSLGQSASFHVTLNSLHHYASTIFLNCQASKPGIQCSANPASATLMDGGTADVTLSVSVAQQSAAIHNEQWKESRSYILWAIAFFPFLPFRSRSKLLRLVKIAVISVALLSCGGGGSSTPPPTGGPPIPQSATITVLGSAQSTQADLNNQKTIGTITLTIN
ncbi:MAG TPA: FG-GAP-like repeat-containing protein [Terriglobales bacterium]|nr:FG-GAP-like repeat-containing protein [Terriglobales bacterium]